MTGMMRSKTIVAGCVVVCPKSGLVKVSWIFTEVTFIQSALLMTAAVR